MPWPQHGMLDGTEPILPCEILVGPNIPTLSTPSRECCEGLHVRRLIYPSSGSQPQTSTSNLSVLQILIKSSCLSSYRPPMQMLASQYFSPFATHNTSECTRSPVHRRLDWLAVLFFCRSQRCKSDGLRSSGHETRFNVQARRGRIYLDLFRCFEI